MNSILTPKIDQSIAFQVNEITRGIKKKSTDTKSRPTITISREFGCEGIPVAKALVKKLSGEHDKWRLFNRDLINEISNEDDLSDELLKAVTEERRSQITQDLEAMLRVRPSDYQVYKRLGQNVKLIGESGNAVIVGSGGSVLAEKEPGFFHVRLTGSFDFRAKRISDATGITMEEARKTVQSRNTARQEFIQEFSRKSIDDPSLYHMILRNDIFDADQIADLIIAGLKSAKLL